MGTGRIRCDNRSLTTILALPAGSPGLAVAQQYVGNPNGFVYALATRYFSVTTAAVRMYDTHHLILGVKAEAQEIQPELLEAAQPYVDVFSIDDYTLQPGFAQIIDEIWPQYLPRDLDLQPLREVREATRSWSGSTPSSRSGPQTPDTVPGVYAVYPTQQARAAAYTNYIAPLYEDAPWVVGDEWFEYVDEPQGGRFDGENNNFGVVNVENQPYQDLVTQMEIMHSVAPDRVVSAGSHLRLVGRVAERGDLRRHHARGQLSAEHLHPDAPGWDDRDAVRRPGDRRGGRPATPTAWSITVRSPGPEAQPSTGLISGTPRSRDLSPSPCEVTDSTTSAPQTTTQALSITVTP